VRFEGRGKILLAKVRGVSGWWQFPLKLDMKMGIPFMWGRWLMEVGWW
jgi:hypothetical protein